MAKKTKNHVSDAALTKPDVIALNQDQVEKLRELEQAVLKYKLQLADLEMSISDITLKKNLLMGTVTSETSKMMEYIKEVARTYDIDPDGDSSSEQWHLNTSNMVFSRIK